MAELMGKWMVAVKDYHVKRMSLLSLFEELTKIKEEYTEESGAAAQKWATLEKDEQTLEQMKQAR